MNDHSITVKWGEGSWGVNYSASCSAPPEALCRAIWDCGCESWSEHGVDENGPWHEVDRHDAETGARHYGTPGGECGQLLFITAADCIDEMGEGEITFPVDLLWDGDTYTWKVKA